MSCSLWKEAGCEDLSHISSGKEIVYVRSHCSCNMAGFETAFSPERDFGGERLLQVSPAGRDLVPGGLNGDPVAGKCCCWNRARVEQASVGDSPNKHLPLSPAVV